MRFDFPAFLNVPEKSGVDLENNVVVQISG
jgi:hypothetical protein